MLSLTPHTDFSPRFEVASCFLEHDGKILLLLRQDHKSEGNTWGIPAGKINTANENSLNGVLRETFEETGIQIHEDNILHIITTYVRYKAYDFVFHIYQSILKEKENIHINYEEHKEFCWVTPQEALHLPLIEDLDKCIRLCYENILENKTI